MATTITASMTFTIQFVRESDCDKFQKAYGTLEIIDCDGDRVAFASSDDDAVEQVKGLLNVFGLDGMKVSWGDSDV